MEENQTNTQMVPKKSRGGLITIIFVALAFVGFMIWVGMKLTNDLRSPGANNGQVGTSSPVTGIGSIPGATISVLPNTPSLNELVIYKSGLDASFKANIATQIDDARKRLAEDSNRYGDWVMLGTFYKNAGDLDKAIKAWEYASALIPNEGTPLNNIGNLYVYEKQEYAKGEEYYKKAVAAEPTFALAYRSLFELYTMTSYKANTTAAIDILKEGLGKNPASLDLFLMLGNYYKGKGDTDSARKYFTDGLNVAKRGGDSAGVTRFEAELSSL